MTDTPFIYSVIVVMTIATIATRLLPFILLKGKEEHPLLEFLGRYMPPAIMSILLLYSMQSIELTASPYGANEFIALLLTMLIHLWRGSALLSIFTGTFIYMYAVQSGLFL